MVMAEEASLNVACLYERIPLTLVIGRRARSFGKDSVECKVVRKICSRCSVGKVLSELAELERKREHNSLSCFLRNDVLECK